MTEALSRGSACCETIFGSAWLTDDLELMGFGQKKKKKEKQKLLIKKRVLD